MLFLHLSSVIEVPSVLSPKLSWIGWHTLFESCTEEFHMDYVVKVVSVIYMCLIRLRFINPIHINIVNIILRYQLRLNPGGIV